MLADISFTTEGIVVITALLGTMGGVVAFMFRMYIAYRDKNEERDRLEMEGLKKSWEEAALEAAKSQRDTLNYYRLRDGLPPMPIVAAVISESHSPSTSLQREVARIATLRAAVAASKLEAGQPPRQEPPKEGEELNKSTPNAASAAEVAMGAAVVRDQAAVVAEQAAEVAKDVQ